MTYFKKSFIAVFTALLTVSCFSVFAHHSAAGYNIETRIAISGELTKSSFRNPHGTLKLVISDEDLGITTTKEGVESLGEVGQEWEIETAAANLLRRRGWEFKNVKKGMKVTLVGHPTKDGTPMIYLREIHLQDGTVFGDPDGEDKALD